MSQLASTFAGRPTYAPRLTLEQGPAGFIADVGSPGNAAVATAATAARDGGQLRVAMPADTACGFNLVVARNDDLDAWTDGVNVTVTSAMLRFVADDDELAAVLAHEIAHTALRHVPAQQKNPATDGQPSAIGDGAMVYSQDFEGDADYAAMYVLARAGRPIATVANLWRRLAQGNPAGMKYASAHPTTPDRFVRLEVVSREIEQQIARGAELRPAMRDGSPSPGSPGSAVAQAPAKTGAAARRAASATAAVLVDRGTQSTALVQVPRESAPTRPSSAGDVALISTTTIVRGDTVSYTFGPPTSRNGLSVPQVRRHAREAYDDGREALELRLYQRAEDKFREAILYDGSDARYHAALGAVLLKRGKPLEAEAVLSAAVLLDVENAGYRQLLVEARKRDE